MKISMDFQLGETIDMLRESVIIVQNCGVGKHRVPGADIEGARSL